jgi:hypothetical protein
LRFLSFFFCFSPRPFFFLRRGLYSLTYNSI